MCKSLNLEIYYNNKKTRADFFFFYKTFIESDKFNNIYLEKCWCFNC